MEYHPRTLLCSRQSTPTASPQVRSPIRLIKRTRPEEPCRHHQGRKEGDGENDGNCDKLSSLGEGKAHANLCARNLESQSIQRWTKCNEWMSVARPTDHDRIKEKEQLYHCLPSLGDAYGR
jgi:hypothetical protein